MLKTVAKFAIPIMAISFIAYSCKDATRGMVPGPEPTPIIVVDCNLPENQMTPDCQKKCTEDPNLPWCAPAAKFNCPTDGSFKAVNPFTGNDLSFAESPGVVPYVTDQVFSLESVFFASSKIFEDGSYKTLLGNNADRLYVDMLAALPTVDLGTTIMSVDALKGDDGKYYALAGTKNDLKIVPFTYDAQNHICSVEEDAVKTINKLGGISQVIVSASVDLSTVASSISTPEGMYASVNVPLSGETAESGSSDIEFVYLLTGDGEIWRIKSEQLLKGGCMERLYTPSQNLDSKNHKMSARKMAVAGQYLAVVASTADGELPNLDADAEDAWKATEDQLIADMDSHKLITQDFYRILQVMAKPQDSQQRVKILDIMTSKNGEFKDVQHKIEQTYRYYVTDLALKGNMLYLSAFKYNLNAELLEKPDANVVNGMIKIWEAATKNGLLQADILKDFNNQAGASLIVTDVNSPTTISDHKMLPRPSALSSDTPTSVFTRIASKDGELYMRGENRYFARVDTSDLSNMPSTRMSILNPYTPWLTLYNEINDKIYTLFLTGGLEIIPISDIQF